ncbi:MAG: ABC transporter substrate-binding protein [Xanthobacteraceae bacterium]
MRRREFITLVGGGAAAVAWPLAGWAQQPDGMRRIGALMGIAENDPDSQARIAALLQGMQDLGWTNGRNVHIDARWSAGDTPRLRRDAAELVALAPNVILANGAPSVEALRQATLTVPVVFVNVIDPVGAGFVESLARPGGNATGFTLFEYGLSGKWLELLKQIAPGVKSVGVLRDSATSSGIGQFAVIQAMAPSFGVELRPIDLHDPGEIERAVTALARSSNGGLIVTGSIAAQVHRGLIIALAAGFRLPAVYSLRYHVASGGLISYGPDPVASFRRTAGYLDRILKGEKPADLPVQAPTKYELVINLKTARALGLELPPMLLATADEVIE